MLEDFKITYYNSLSRNLPLEICQGFSSNHINGLCKNIYIEITNKSLKDISVTVKLKNNIKCYTTRKIHNKRNLESAPEFILHAPNYKKCSGENNENIYLFSKPLKNSIKFTVSLGNGFYSASFKTSAIFTIVINDTLLINYELEAKGHKWASKRMSPNENCFNPYSALQNLLKIDHN